MPATSTFTDLKLSPVDFVRGLSLEDKGKVLVSLLREAIESDSECGLLPIFDDEDGKPFGYYIPPKAAESLAERDLPKLTPERERELVERGKLLHTAIPMSQAVDELKQKARNLQTQSP